MLFDKSNIEKRVGTVHTFQGKEASVVIFCLAASKARNSMGGLHWANQKPNLINVAVTRAKNHLFVLGNAVDWQTGTFSASMLDQKEMEYYANFEDFVKSNPSTKPISAKQQNQILDELFATFD